MTATRALRLATGPSGDPDLDRRWIARRLALDTAAVEAASALDAAGIPVILLKGPVTAARLYSGEFRPYLDIDLLVAPTAYAKAGAVLASLGYDLRATGPVARTYVRPNDGCSVDLHRSLRCAGADPAVVWRVLSRHRVPFRLRKATRARWTCPRSDSISRCTRRRPARVNPSPLWTWSARCGRCQRRPGRKPPRSPPNWTPWTR